VSRSDGLHHVIKPSTYASTSASEDAVLPEQQLTWSEEEEKRLVRKVDWIVMTLLILGFGALQLDRGNIGNALTDYFLEDVGITQDQFNIGQQLLSVGIVLLEIPSNLVLYRLGPRAWISGQIFAWGLVALFQAFQKGVGAFMATRLRLGLGESGFIPASLYCITTFYKRGETSKRFSWFFLGNMIALASGNLLAYGILQMRGICGLAGWQWMFILEGLFTILVSFIFAAFFPKDPAHPIPLLGIRYFNERESAILAQRVLRDDPSKLKKSHTISKTQLLNALSNWRAYPHLILTLCAVAPATTLGSYAPTLVATLGYGRLRSNALVSVGWWIQIVLNVCLGYIADKTKQRGLCTLAGLSLWWGFCLGNFILADSTYKSAKYALLTLALSVENIWHPINGSWLALNSRSPAERSITMAMFITAANAAGIIGSQLFQSSDSPHYRTGWAAIFALLTVAMICCIVANIQYRVLNSKNPIRAVIVAEAEGEDGAREAAFGIERLRYQL